jgi:hypothetical protein
MDRSLVSRYISRADLGKVVQAKIAQTTTDYSRASNVFGDWTNMSLTITPSAINSTFYIICTSAYPFNNGGGGDVNFLQIVRDSTSLAEEAAQTIAANPSGALSGGSQVWTWLDSPATTSAITYKAQVRSQNSYNITYRWGSLIVFEVLP